MGRVLPCKKARTRCRESAVQGKAARGVADVDETVLAMEGGCGQPFKNRGTSRTVAPTARAKEVVQAYFRG